MGSKCEMYTHFEHSRKKFHIFHMEFFQIDNPHSNTYKKKFHPIVILIVSSSVLSGRAER